MTIERTDDGTKTTFTLHGPLNSEGSKTAAAELKRLHNKTNELVLDCGDVDYVSSSGLRFLLLAQKKMNKKGTMRLIDVPASVAYTLEIRGFEDILYIERREDADTE
ncbi:MAG: STAS domain-containing protein [Oscillospiraceae bacterium]|nr:STAS domain-containing protein [Oscillospiraceae bacterium]